MLRWIRRFYKRAEFSRDHPVTGAQEVIRWWEERRPFFNIVVGCTGILTCLLLLICAFSSEASVGEAIGMPDGPLLGIFFIPLYAILANICYTGGWVTELVARATAKADLATALGLWAFRWGISVSIFVTLTPAIVCWIAFAVALLRGQKHGPINE